MTDITKMISDINSTIKDTLAEDDTYVDQEALVKFFNDKTRPLYGVDLFKIPTPNVVPVPQDMGDMGGGSDSDYNPNDLPSDIADEPMDISDTPPADNTDDDGGSTTTPSVEPGLLK